jgi:hypothetical protein
MHHIGATAATSHIGVWDYRVVLALVRGAGNQAAAR